MPSTRLPDLGAQLLPFLQRVPAEVRPRLLARLERAAADRYRAWASSCADASQAEGLRACAVREEEVATRVEGLFAATTDEDRHIAAVLPEIARTYIETLDARPRAEQYTMQAASERRGAEVWRGLAASAAEPAARDALLACAALEEASAAFLETLVRGSG